MGVQVGIQVRNTAHEVIVRNGAHQVFIGGNHPVVVQSMTNTDTADALGTALQVKELSIAGSELVRITVNSPEAAARLSPSPAASITLPTGRKPGPRLGATRS